MEALAVGAGCDSGGLGLHGKANIHMTEPAGESGTMQPMIKDDRSRACGGRKVVENDLSVVGRLFRGRWGQINLARPSSSQKENCADEHEEEMPALISFRSSFLSRAHMHKGLGTFVAVPGKPSSVFRRVSQSAAAEHHIWKSVL